MSLLQELKDVLPELTDKDFSPNGTIVLQDDSDGEGPYIAKWEYSKPIPKGFRLGK